MSNNSPKEFGIYEAIESAPAYILEILSVIEETLREFNVTVKYQCNSTTITIQDKKNRVHGETFRIISLDIFTKPNSYAMNLYQQTNLEKDAKLIYEIKVKGNYELKTLKTNLEKLIKSENLTHRSRFYPF
ncbi:MAG: hypothetical protein HWN79_01990 [Candidatus Lokiarchaeota archaeon]|nr:hypothetical protein [Candidatus Lokiarchaeota archaeon]